MSTSATAQVSNFAGNGQHTNVYSVSANPLNRIIWQKSIDDIASFAHYGAPMITAAGTVLVGHTTSGYVFQVDAYDSAGNSMYTLPSDYTLPPGVSWVPPYQGALVGTRFYYPGNGGTVYYVDSVDGTPTAATQLAFYGLSNYTGNPSGFNSTISINSPITADSSGNIYFTFRTTGTAPAPISSGASGVARIDSSGNGSYVLVNDAVNDPTIATNEGRTQHGSAIALSNDESSIYLYMKDTQSDAFAFLVQLDASTLLTLNKVRLWDPRAPGVNGARCIDQSTAGPMVAPDGDVYAPVFANPYNGSRGFLLHFTGDLTVQKNTGAFGWDYTPGVVPTSMVPSYHGSSSYLLFTKYNNYTVTDGDGVNRVALLDPNDCVQTDFHPTAPGLVEMREVMSLISPTPDDQGGSYPLAVREWCINASAVNPTTNSIIFNNEDGHIYRWDTFNNSMAEVVKLNDGVGQPYVPSEIGPDGNLYTLNGGNLFCVGSSYTNGGYYTVTSSLPNVRSVSAGDSITFTAQVHGGTGTPTGTFDFTDDTYNGLTPEQNILATGVAVDSSGIATFTTSSLSAGGAYFGNHRITVTYSGDGGHDAGTAAMLQKVHAYSTSVNVGVPGSAFIYGSSQAITATVSASSGTPTGYVFFRVGNQALGQAFLDGSGVATINTSAIPAGNQTITAEYESDTYYASSSGTGLVNVAGVSGLTALPLKFRSGTTSTGTVTIGVNAPSGGVDVALSSNNAALGVPATVNIPSGQNSANFTITGTNTTYTDIIGTITATLGSSANKSLIVQPDNRSSFISQSVPTTMTVGQSYNVALVFKNMGTTTWDTAHGYQLYSQNPDNNSTWGLNRIPKSGGNVAPGANGTFSASVTAPSSPGTYNFQWICYEQGNNMKFGPVSTNVAVSVLASADSAHFVSQTAIPTSVGPSATFSAQFVMQNTGSATWNALNYSLLPIGSNNFGVASITSPTVAPNANGSFPAASQQTFTAPATPGTYTFHWRMAHGSTLFGEATDQVTIIVSNDASQYVSGTVPLTLNAGTDIVVTYVMKNTGINTWTPGAGYSMMTVNPNNDGTWGSTRLALPGAASISPGQNGTFTGYCSAPITPGTYTMQWQTDKGGVPFGDKTPLLTINVVQGPDDAGFVSMSDVPMSVGPSTTFGATFTMQNLGTATWDSTYALLPSPPPGSFGVSSITSGSVAPNATGNFTASFTAPSTPGTYSFRWRMAHNGTRFGQATPAYNITVSADAAQYISSSIPTTVDAGSDFPISVIMKNTGTTTWTAAGGYSMLTLNPLNNTTWGANRLTLGAAVSIAPNHGTQFSRSVTAPATPGTYVMQWQMNNNGAVFGEPTTSVSINVVAGADGATWVSQTVPTTVVHGATFSASVTMKNTGTATWNGSYSLASVGSSNFGVPQITSGTVAPNANGVFSTTFTAPVTPGTYTFRWRMQNGTTKFGQASLQVTINVT